MENSNLGRLRTRLQETAHDVRTPLTTIAGFADLLMDDSSLSPSARDNATAIVEETRRLTVILESFFSEFGGFDEA